MTAKNKVEVRINGKEYSIVGSESEEYIQRIGLYMDKKMSEIMRMNNKLSTSMAAVLTAMNVADDYFKCHESEGSLKKENKKQQDELQYLKEEKRKLVEENSALGSINTSLQLELAKREAELREVRNSLDKTTRARV